MFGFGLRSLLSGAITKLILAGVGVVAIHAAIGTVVDKIGKGAAMERELQIREAVIEKNRGIRAQAEAERVATGERLAAIDAEHEALKGRHDAVVERARETAARLREAEQAPCLCYPDSIIQWGANDD